MKKLREKIGSMMAVVVCLVFMSASCEKPPVGPDGDGGSGKTYKVGDLYNVNGVRGIVYKTTDNGTHGYIVSLDAIVLNDYQWSTVKEVTGATDEDNGANNMAKIKTMANWETNYPAFKYWDDKGWYIPAKNEAKAICDNYETIYNAIVENGGNGDLLYIGHTSTEASEDKVYFYQLQTMQGNTYEFSAWSKTIKGDKHNTRGVRKF